MGLLDPTARLDGEPNLWYSRFHRFLLMGPRRSILGTYRQERNERELSKPEAERKPVAVRSAPPTWDKAARRWHWRERAEAWDRVERARQREQWQQRQTELRQAEWVASQALLEKARVMLEFPVAREEHSEDGATVIVEPAGWRFVDVAKIVDTASKLGRLAAELETNRSKAEISHPDDLDVDLSNLTHDELGQLLAIIKRVEVSDADDGPEGEDL